MKKMSSLNPFEKKFWTEEEVTWGEYTLGMLIIGIAVKAFLC